MVIQWGAGRRSSVLDRPTNSISLSEGQSFTDQLVSASIQEATNLKTAASLLGAGFASRAARIGALSSLPSQGLWAPALRWASHLPALAAESATFAGLERTFHPSPHPFQKDWARAAVTLTGLKLFGGIGREQNTVLQHLFTDLGLVGSQHAGAAIGLTDRPQGSFARQMLQAEATLWQLKGSLSLAHSLTPRLGALERSLDLALSQESIDFPPELPRLDPKALALPRGSPSLKEAREGALQEGVFKMTSSDPQASSPPLKSHLSGDWNIKELFEPSFLASLPEKGFFKRGGFQMKSDARTGDIKIYESVFELLLFRTGPSRRNIIEIGQYEQTQDKFLNPHEDAGRLPAVLAKLQRNRVLSKSALSLLGISPEEVAAAEPLQRRRTALKARIKALNRNKPEDLPPSSQYAGTNTHVVHQGSANFLHPQGRIDGLYTEGLGDCIAVIGVARDGAGGPIKNIGLAHIDAASEKNLRQFFHHLRKGEKGPVDLYLIGDPLQLNQDLSLRIFRVLEGEDAHLRFVSVNRTRRNVDYDSVLVDRQGRVYYGDREDLSSQQDPNYGTYVESLREAAGYVLVFPDLETAPPSTLPTDPSKLASPEEPDSHRPRRRDLLDQQDRLDMNDWKAWERWRKKKPGE